MSLDPFKEYPKIDTLFDRDQKTFKVDTTKVRRIEFDHIKQWILTEKINGMNIRILFFKDGTIKFVGKTNDAVIPAELLKYLQETFTPDKLKLVFRNDPTKEICDVCIIGEGYGARIVAGSGIYGKTPSFRLIDCYIAPFWLERTSLEDIAKKLGIKCVPIIGTLNNFPRTRAELREAITNSIVAKQENDNCILPEGIVAMPLKQFFDRQGRRIMWKLKFSDFPNHDVPPPLFFENR